MAKLATRLRAGRRRARREHRLQVWAWEVKRFENRVRRRGRVDGHDPMGKFILIDGQPRRLAAGDRDLRGWGMWMEMRDGGRIVKQTRVRKLLVSTVFLGLDHSFFRNSDSPVLWETMVFGDEGGDWEHFQRRYRSLDAAKAGHREAVDEVRHGIILDIDSLNQ